MDDHATTEFIHSRAITGMVVVSGGEFSNYRPRNKPVASTILGCQFSLPAALRAAQTCRYFIYSEADFEVFGPQGRHVAPMGGEIWHG